MTMKGLLKVWSLSKSNFGNISQTTPLMLLYVPYSFHPERVDETSTLWSSRQNNCHGDVIKSSMEVCPMEMSAKQSKWLR